MPFAILTFRYSRNSLSKKFGYVIDMTNAHQGLIPVKQSPELDAPANGTADTIAMTINYRVVVATKFNQGLGNGV